MDLGSGVKTLVGYKHLALENAPGQMAVSTRILSPTNFNSQRVMIEAWTPLPMSPAKFLKACPGPGWDIGPQS